jgi:hypothetical protein
MNLLYKVPLEQKDLSRYLEEEQYFLKGLIELIKENDSELGKKQKQIVADFIELLPDKIEKIYPLKKPADQIQSLLFIANHFSKTFGKIKIKELTLKHNWISLIKGYLGKLVEEKYEIAILLYLVALIYQWRARAFVQTSVQYRYYHISALSAIKGAILFIEELKPKEEEYAYLFLQSLNLRKIEIEAEITKSEAFIARKKGDFEKAANLFAGVASYRFSMMNFELPTESDNQVKIFASTELGMACFYIAVGLSTKNDSENAYSYLLKARSYFENTVKLSENDTELLETANKRLDLVTPYIDKIKDSIKKANVDVEKIPDPQPIMHHIEAEPLLVPGTNAETIPIICSSCYAKIPWAEKCSKCGEKILPLE